MGVEYLCRTEEGVVDEDAGGGLADKPVARDDIYGRAVERVWVDCGSHYREPREYHQACSQRAAVTHNQHKFRQLVAHCP